MASVATFGGDTPLAVQLIRQVLDDETGRDPAPVARSIGPSAFSRRTVETSRPHEHSSARRFLLARKISPAFAREIECSRAATSSTPDDIAESLGLLDRAAADAIRTGSIVVAQWSHDRSRYCVRQGTLDAGAQHARDRRSRCPIAPATPGRREPPTRPMATVLGARDGWAAAVPQFRLSFDAHLLNGDIPARHVWCRASGHRCPPRRRTASRRRPVDVVPHRPRPFHRVADVRGGGSAGLADDTARVPTDRSGRVHPRPCGRVSAAGLLRSRRDGRVSWTRGPPR